MPNSRRLLLALGLLAVPIATVRAQGGGAVAGVARDSASGAPLAGVRVELLGTRLAGVARDDGRFRLAGVPAGEYRARLTLLGYRQAVVGPLRVGDGADTPLDVALPRAATSLSTVVVTPGFYGVLESAAATTQTMTREQIAAVPQLAEDIYRAVNRLPGVTSDEYAAAFSVRGFGADELYASFDGLELVEPYHLKDIRGGAISILDADAMGGVELTTGGYSAEYGDRLGGVFTMRSVDPRRDRTRTALGISVMNARASSQGGFAGGRGGWLVSARRGYLDLALRLTSSNDSLKPRYYDAFAKVDYDLPRGGRVSAHVLRAGDSMTYHDGDESALQSGYASTYGWVTWEGAPDARLRQRTVASIGRLTWTRDAQVYDLNASRQRVQTGDVDDGRSLTALGLRQDWSFDVGTRALLKWGVDARHESADYDYARWMLEESVSRAGQVVTTLDSSVASPSLAGTRLGLYLAQRLRLVDAVTVEVGVRHDRAAVVGGAVTSPRLNVSWQPRAGTTVRAAWGRYSQSQALAAIQVQDGVSALARAERSEQRVLGVEQALPRGMSVRLEAYDQRVRSRRPRWMNAGGELDLVPELTWDRVFIAAEAGRSRGVELLVTGDRRGRVAWSASYALAEATDRVAGRDVPRLFDQRHTLHYDWSVHPLSNKWRLSVATQWRTGWPYAPQLVRIDTIRAAGDQWGILPTRYAGELGSERFPRYHRVDARWTRYFDTRRGRLSLFAEVFNLFNTKNVGSYTKNVFVDGRTGRVSYGRSTDTTIPRLPTAGIAWEF